MTLLLTMVDRVGVPLAVTLGLLLIVGTYLWWGPEMMILACLVAAVTLGPAFQAYARWRAATSHEEKGPPYASHSH